MTPQQISRFPMLAELRACLKNYANVTNVPAQIANVQTLLALLPEVDQFVEKELSILGECQVSLENSYIRFLDLLQRVDQEYQEILQHVSSQSWYENHLRVSTHQREKWQCNINQLQDLLLVWTKMNDTWKYPIALINAQHKEVINVLISCYLLYMIDVDRDLLVKQLDALENSVQPRVKYHVIPSYDWDRLDWQTYIGYTEQQIRWGVPTGQMALVVVWNLFERYNAWAIEQSLLKIRELLRPGGQVFFNTFDIESSHAAAFVADGTLGGITKSQLTQLAEKLGLDVKFWIPRGSDYVTVLLARPDTLDSNKTKWPLGLIKKS